MQKVMSKMRRAMQNYRMVEPGDHIGVGVSGGKDSLVLLCALSEMRRFYPVPYTLSALVMDPQFGGTPTDFSPVEALCRKLDVPFVYQPTALGSVVFERREEKNPCSLCAKMRRGILHDMAKEQGCTRVALGHHMDDTVETFYMNLLLNGHIGCFSPVSYLARKGLDVLRPMISLPEKEVRRVCRRLALPVVKSRCPVDGETQRETTKALLRDLERRYPGLREKTLGALERRGIDGWGAK